MPTVLLATETEGTKLYLDWVSNVEEAPEKEKSEYSFEVAIVFGSDVRLGLRPVKSGLVPDRADWKSNSVRRLMAPSAPAFGDRPTIRAKSPPSNSKRLCMSVSCESVPCFWADLNCAARAPPHPPASTERPVVVAPLPPWRSPSAPPVAAKSPLLVVRGGCAPRRCDARHTAPAAPAGNRPVPPSAVRRAPGQRRRQPDRPGRTVVAGSPGRGAGRRRRRLRAG